MNARMNLAAMLALAFSGIAQAAGPSTMPAAPLTTVVIYTKDKPPATPELEDLPLQASVTKDDVTWTFERPARVGQFVNGDWYVVGEVTVTKIDPAPIWGADVKQANQFVSNDYEKDRRKPEELIRNGSILSPPAENGLTNFDSRSHNFTTKGRVRPPIAMKPGDALISTASEVKGHSVSGGASPVKSASILTCLNEPVPLDAWRPSYGDHSQTIYLARNLRRDKLLKLPVPPKAPDYKALAKDYAAPWLEISYYGVGATRNQHSQYGRAVCQAGVEACLSLLMDYPPQEKEPLLIGYVQYGIDLYGLVKNGHTGWIGDGGWGAGRKWPMVFAGLMLDQPDLCAVSKSFPKAVLAEDTQIFYDDCWTGAGVCFAFDSRKGSRREAGWGEYEHLHPSRWDSCHGQFYRCDMTGSTWVGQALVIHLMGAEKAWDGEVFLDYCDRWMYEPDPGFGTWGKQGEGYKVRGAWSWFNAMWDKYRMHPPMPDGKEAKPYPNDGWKRKDPPTDADSVPVRIGANRELIVKGKPFLPIMMWAETTSRAALAKKLGMNTIAEGCFLAPELPNAMSNKALLDEVAKAGLYGIFGADMRVAGHPNLLGWMQVDEPDKVLVLGNKAVKEWRNFFPGFELMMFTGENGKYKDIPPHTIVSTAYEWMKKWGKTRPVFLTLGGQLLKGEGPVAQAIEDKEFPTYLPYGDFVGCAVYLVTGGQAGGKVQAVAAALAELRRMGGAAKPVFAWVEAAPRVTGVVRNASDIRASYDRKPKDANASATAAAPLAPPTAAQIRAQAWMAIIGGATAIGYRGFEGFAEVKLGDGAEAELQRLNAQITRLAPAILAAPAQAKIEMSMADDGPCHVKATELDGATHVFAQSLAGGGKDPLSTKATIKLAGLKAGTKIEVVDESRALTAQDGQFTDDFAPLAEHVYRWKP